MRLRSHKLLLLLAGAFIAAGCGSAKLDASFSASSNMNDGNAVKVVVMQLSSRAAFESTPRLSFWENYESLLAGDMIGTKQEFTLFPDSSHAIPVKIEEGALFLGIAAGYFEPDEQGWRVLYPIDEVNNKTVRITAGQDRLTTDIN